MKMKRLIFGTHRYAPDLAILILRIGFGFFLAHYGWNKLIHFDEKVAGWPDPLHVGSFLSLSLTVFSELVCSLLVMIGFLTRPALAVLMVTMFIIIFVIHAGDPLSEREHGFSFLIPFLAIFLLGPGQYSVDAAIKK
jgi:putative oxidoreductase